MNHYNYQERFKELYEKAIAQFKTGNTDKDTYFNDDEIAFIRANGLRIQDFFDYAEDHVDANVPSYEIAQSIEQTRREYFLHKQNAQSSKRKIQPEELPAKSDHFEGIVWLPRIIQKAKGKLAGELDDDIMYCCGGDRKFLSTHDIHPSEFLRLVWSKWDNPQEIVDFVKQRSPEISQLAR